MHVTPRLDLRAFYVALALAALGNAALYAAARVWGFESTAAGQTGFVAAFLLGAGCYWRRSGVPFWGSRDGLQQPGKKKRSRKQPDPASARPTLDVGWGLRAAALLLGALAIQWGAAHTGLVTDPTWPAWRAEVVTFGGGLIASVGLLAWGARFWLQVMCPDALAPPSAKWQIIRDYGPGLICLLATWGMLWVRVPALFLGEMSSDMAQGLFWAAYEAAPWHFDGAGIALFAQGSAYALHALQVPVTWVPFIYQGLACALLGACTTAFAWPAFRRLLPSDLARFLICAALACQPDYAQKTLAHVGGYGAVVVLLLVWLALRKRDLTWAWAVGAGAAVSLLALGHAGGVAFAPVLSVLLAAALIAKRLPQAAFCALALVGPWAQVWALALPHRAASAGAAPDAGPVGALIAKYTAMLPIWSVGGKALLSLPSGDDGAYVLWICAGVAAIACLLQVVASPLRRPWLGLGAVALGTTAAGVACHVLMVPESTAASWTSGGFAGLAAPAWFVPCVATFLALAVGIGSSALNKHVPWALCLWLFAGYPFGLGQLPRDQFWPAHGFSAWQAVAPKVLGHAPPRGCIPVDPFPNYLSMDCQLLHSVGSATGLGGWMTFFNQVPLPAPALAEGWSVDSIGIAFNKTPPLDAGPWEIPITLVALTSDGREIARSETVFHPPEIFTYFTFEKPLEQVAKTRLVITQNTSLAMGIESQQTREPFWVWFGRGQPEEGGEGVHLALPARSVSDPLPPL